MSNRSNTELWTSRLIWTAVVGNLRRIDNPPVLDSEIFYGPIANRPQVTNLPHKNYFCP